MATLRCCFILVSMWEEDAPQRPSVKALGRLAAERLEQLRTDGVDVSPVVNRSRKLAANFWGSAWMRHLARCEAGGLCLAPGRSLLRHGCVLDLNIGPGVITALVCEDEIYEVELRIAPLCDEQMENLRAACCGRISSLISLLEGKVDAAVLELLCAPEGGLLPEPCDWHMSCSCPDWTEPCPHAAAAIYAAGTLIDADPMLLFRLRSLAPEELLAAPAVPGSESHYDANELSSLFHIDIDVTQ